MRSDQVLTNEQAGVTPAPPSRMDRLLDSLTDPSQYAVLGAEWNRGLLDAQTLLMGELGGTHEEPGTIGSPTLQINNDRIGVTYQHDGPEME